METQQPRKRVKKAKGDENETQQPSARGRPRLNIAPENSKERRRAQIRQAQRAYRGRKEDTITTLNRRVESLESVISDMSNAFAAFESSAAGFGPELRERMRRTAEQMAVLAAKSAEGTETVPSPESLESRSSGVGESPADASTPENMAPRFQPPSRGFVTPDSGRLRPTLVAGDKRDYSSFERQDTETPASHPMPQTQSSLSTPQPQPQPQKTSHESNSQLCNISGDPIITSQMLDTLSIPLDLLPPQSYSHLETSFTRRLLRSSLEAAQRLLRNPHANPAQIHRLGRYAVCYMKQTRLLAWFEQVWSRPAHANLERWIAPIFHIGGAGLHFPREGIDAGSTRPEQWDQPGRIGPPTLMPVDRPEARHLSQSQVVDFANVGGEWYDSNDVEEYLKTRGIFLDATSNVVEVCEDEVPGMVSSHGTSDSQSTARPSSPANAEAVEQARGTPFGPYWSMDEDFGAQVAEPRVQTYEFDFTFSGAPGFKAKRLVDVEVFMAGEFPSPMGRLGVN